MASAAWAFCSTRRIVSPLCLSVAIMSSTFVGPVADGTDDLDVGRASPLMPTAAAKQSTPSARKSRRRIGRSPLLVPTVCAAVVIDISTDTSSLQYTIGPQGRPNCGARLDFGCMTGAGAGCRHPADVLGGGPRLKHRKYALRDCSTHAEPFIAWIGNRSGVGSRAGYVRCNYANGGRVSHDGPELPRACPERSGDPRAHLRRT